MVEHGRKSTAAPCLDSNLPAPAGIEGGTEVKMLGVLLAGSQALAGECARITLDEVTLAMEGATAVEVRDVTGGLRIVSGDGDRVRARGWACAAGTKVHLARNENVIVATVSGEVAGLELELCVPRSLPALTVQGHTGPVGVNDVPAMLAVERGTGPVGVHETGSARIAHLTGPVAADEIDGDLVLEHVTGPVVARDVHGDVTADAITGQMTVEDVEGDLVVEGGVGHVLHSGVDGQVRLR